MNPDSIILLLKIATAITGIAFFVVILAFLRNRQPANRRDDSTAINPETEKLVYDVANEMKQNSGRWYEETEEEKSERLRQQNERWNQMSVTIQINKSYKAKGNQKYYAVIKSNNNKVIWQSEMYKTHQGVMKNAQRMKEYIENPEYHATIKDKTKDEAICQNV